MKQNVSVAYIVFRKASGVKNACNLTYDTERFLSDKDNPLFSGLRGIVFFFFYCFFRKAF